MRSRMPRWQAERAVAYRVLDHGARVVGELKSDALRCGPSEHLDCIVIPGLSAVGYRHPRVCDGGVEHVLAVSRRLLPPLEEPLGQLLSREPRGAELVGDVLGDDTVVVAVLLRPR